MKQTSSAAEAAAVTEAEVQAHALMLSGIEGSEVQETCKSSVWLASGHRHASHRSGFRRASLSWSQVFTDVSGCTHDIPLRRFRVASSC